MGKYTDYTAHALNEVIQKFGNVLVNNLAVLLPELYQLFIREGMKKVYEMKLSISESQLTQEMPKRCFLSRLVCFFGKHLSYACTHRSLGVLLYRQGANLQYCLSKALKLMQHTSGTSISEPKCDTNRYSWIVFVQE